MNAIPELKDRVDNAPLWSPGSSRKTSRPTRIIRPLSVKTLMDAPRASYLVKGVFPDKGVAAIYGPSASGKTFLTLDVALAVARGTPWFGHRVKQAAVIYIAAEGESGISDRLRAALGSESGEVPLEVIPAPVDLLRGEDHLNALNAIINFALNGIVLGNTSKNVNVQSNGYSGNGTNVSNAGTGNTLGGGSP